MDLNPEIWAPHYHFFIQSVAINYPTMPNEITKKKYYDLIQNIPFFVPHNAISKKLLSYLDKYPVTPYLDSRDSFLKWINFIHNKINIEYNKPLIDVVDSINNYYDNYKPKKLKNIEEIHMREKIIYSSIIVLAIIYSYFMYNK